MVTILTIQIWLILGIVVLLIAIIGIRAIKGIEDLENGILIAEGLKEPGKKYKWRN